ncbi:hypothetical protein C1878_08195 [Gordonibacter sp. 28C]|uniref:DUF5692 family protein n=1 Tax=Gordonibacter sp. 28C TaxID=2078569 RepID=UPI000DF7D721|nr:DUF5692 family protein [Gordonibacter sp. 28C]RDB62296.1 hypothetical protein C1878_08195 [Gordonibacter sp. 28C]
MLFQVYGENAIFQWLGLIAVFAILMILNFYSIKSKKAGIFLLLVMPALVTVYCVAVNVGAAMGADWALRNQTHLYMNGWFHYAKLYAATCSCIGIIMVRFQWGVGKKKWFAYNVMIMLNINILIAVASDVEHALNAWYAWELSSEGVWLYGGWHNVMNAIAGLLCIAGTTAWNHIYVSKPIGKDGRDLIWADLIWVWIIAYDLWNFAYTYNNLPTHAWYCGLALLLAPTVLAFVWNKGSWIPNRGHTLLFWCMFAQVFPLFMEGDSPFAVLPAMYADGVMTNGAVNVLPMTVVSALALAANVGCVITVLYRSVKLKKNPYFNEMFTDTKDYRKAMERVAFQSGVDKSA